MAKKLYQLSDCDINEIAFCNVPAVPDATFKVLKSGDGDSNPEFEYTVKFAKTDVEKKQAIAFALVPDKFDKQGHRLTSDEVEKAAHSYAKNLAHKAQKGLGTSENHQTFGQDGYIVESWIDGDGSVAKSLGIDPIPGAWVIKFQFTNDEVWDKVKKGEYTGVSIGGSGMLEPVEKSSEEVEKGALVKLIHGLAKAVGIEVLTEPIKKAPDFNQVYAEQNFDDFFWDAKVALSDTLWWILYDEDVTDKAAAATESINQFRDKIVAFFSGVETGDIEKNLKSLDDIRTLLKTEIQKRIEKSDTSDGGTDAMEKEQFDKLMGVMTGLTEKVDGFEKRLDEAGIAKTDDKNDPEDTKKTDGEPAPEDTRKSVGDAGEQLLAKMEELVEKVDGFDERLSKVEKKPQVRKGDIDGDTPGSDQTDVKKGQAFVGTGLSFRAQ